MEVGIEESLGTEGQVGGEDEHLEDGQQGKRGYDCQSVALRVHHEGVEEAPGQHDSQHVDHRPHPAHEPTIYQPSRRTVPVGQFRCSQQQHCQGVVLHRNKHQQGQSCQSGPVLPVLG